MNYPAILTQWHAQALSGSEAASLMQRAERRQKYHASNHQSCFVTTLMQLIASWWLDPQAGHDLERVYIYATTRRQRALCHLVTGQLLMSRKMTGAMTHLNKGLKFADGLVKSDDYFEMYNRHATLRHLLLSDTGQPAQGLEVLLNEARVIQRLNKHNLHGRFKEWPEQFSIP